MECFTRQKIGALKVWDRQKKTKVSIFGCRYSLQKKNTSFKLLKFNSFFTTRLSFFTQSVLGMGLAFYFIGGLRKVSKGLWPAVSGSIAQSERLDAVANNLANVNTNGFKKDQVAFRSVLSSAVSAAQKEDIPRKPYTEKDFHRLDGSTTTYVIQDGTHTDFAQGATKLTGSPLDVALEGKGFLEVLAPQGSRFTRQGSLRLGQDGMLVTMEGFPVLSKGGVGGENGAAPVSREELVGRAIRIDPSKSTQVSITSDGKIFQGREQVGEMSVVEFVDTKMLTKEGSSLYHNESPANISADIRNTAIRQGMLETSNVNAVQEMTEMLKATRLFEANQKMVKTYGEMESRMANDIGKL